MTAFALVALAGLLSFANGANDVSKGVATLVGSGRTSLRHAVRWGAAWTGVGAASAAALSGAMLVTFQQSTLAPGSGASLTSSVAALSGATAWILIATRQGLPVSTTHALVGGMLGATMAAHGMDAVSWASLSSRVLLPLVLSPVVALVAMRLVLKRWQRHRGAASVEHCVCLTVARAPALARVTLAGHQQMAAGTMGLDVRTGTATACSVHQPQALRLTGDSLHWLASGVVSFSRGLNDTPKIVALLLAAAALAPGQLDSPGAAFGLVAMGMVVGSLVGGRGVTRVLAEEVTTMDPMEGLAANIVTAALVTTGAVYGLPMSTTHVASGSIAGIGVRRGALRFDAVRHIGLAWIVTLPAATALSALIYAAGMRLLP
ncbi:MAG: anion permease [Vicinamibacterales bacterium]